MKRLTLPLSDTISFGDSGYQLRFDLPFEYTKISDSDSYGTALGASLRIPVSDSWGLTPGIRAGLTGSLDMASAGVVYAGTLTSNYTIPFNAFEVNIANMVGTIRTGSVGVGDYEIDYDLSNTVYKNGISFEGETPWQPLSLPTSWKVWLAYTFFTGDELFIDNYWDFSLSWGQREGILTSWCYLHLRR